MTEPAAQKSWRKAIFRGGHHSLWKELLSWKFALTTIALLLLSDPIEHLWPFEYAGLRSTEIFLHGVAPRPARYTRIVELNPDYYAQHLQNDCLQPDELLKIARALLNYRPAVLVVDFDTSSSKYAGLEPPGNGIPIIWARDARDETGAQGRIELKPQPLLGKTPSPDAKNWGYALFPQNRDWTVREYRRTFDVEGKPEPSLFQAAVEAYCREPSRTSECPRATESKSEKLTVPLSKSRYDIPRLPLEDLYEPGVERKQTASSPLTGKIVLLGGTYADRHATAWGTVNGVELVAAAIESELDPHEENERLAEAGTMLMRIALALVIFVLHHKLRPLAALFATGFLLSGLVFFGAMLVLWFTAYRAEFVPFLVGIWLEQTYEVAAHSEEELRKLEETSAPHPA